MNTQNPAIFGMVPLRAGSVDLLMQFDGQYRHTQEPTLVGIVHMSTLLRAEFDFLYRMQNKYRGQ